METTTTPADLASTVDEMLTVLIAKNMRSQRALRGWDQSELAIRCGIHRTVVAKIETKRRNTSVGELFMLSKVFESGSIADFLRPGAIDLAPDQIDAFKAFMRYLEHSP